jgi:hypothetical protein
VLCLRLHGAMTVGIRVACRVSGCCGAAEYLAVSGLVWRLAGLAGDACPHESVRVQSWRRAEGLLVAVVGDLDVEGLEDRAELLLGGGRERGAQLGPDAPSRDLARPEVVWNVTMMMRLSRAARASAGSGERSSWGGRARWPRTPPRHGLADGPVRSTGVGGLLVQRERVEQHVPEVLATLEFKFFKLGRESFGLGAQRPV